MTGFSTVIVDDEPPARRRLRQLLEDEPDFLVVGEARNAREAVELITAHRPAVVFLDVRMPGADGFSVLGRLEELPPAVVFVTAYDSHAVRAFEVEAVDYLVKPVSRRRFGSMLDRVRSHLQAGPRAEQDRHEALARAAAEGPYLRRVAVRVGGRIRLLEVDTIDYFEATGNYIKLHTRAGSHVIRDSLVRLESALDPAGFVRIHRSTIVNLARIVELEAQSHGDYQVRLDSGQLLSLSRNYRDRFKGRFGPEF